MEKLPVNKHGISQSLSEENHHNHDLDEDVFKCSCGNSIPIKGINIHFKDCPEMKEKYSKLFMSIDKLVSKQADCVQDWVNMKVMFTFLEGHMKMMINKEKKKPNMFKNKRNGSSGKDINMEADSKSSNEGYYEKLQI